MAHVDFPGFTPNHLRNHFNQPRTPSLEPQPGFYEGPTPVSPSELERVLRQNNQSNATETAKLLRDQAEQIRLLSEEVEELHCKIEDMLVLQRKMLTELTKMTRAKAILSKIERISQSQDRSQNPSGNNPCLLKELGTSTNTSTPMTNTSIPAAKINASKEKTLSDFRDPWGYVDVPAWKEYLATDQTHAGEAGVCYGPAENQNSKTRPKSPKSPKSTQSKPSATKSKPKSKRSK